MRLRESWAAAGKVDLILLHDPSRKISGVVGNDVRGGGEGADLFQQLCIHATRSWHQDVIKEILQ